MNLKYYFIYEKHGNTANNELQVKLKLLTELFEKLNVQCEMEMTREHLG